MKIVNTNLNFTECKNNTQIVSKIMLMLLSVITLFIILSCDISATDYGDKSYIIASINTSNNFYIEHTSQKSFLDSINLTVDSVPKNDSRQTVEYINLYPESGHTTDGKAYFDWRTPTIDQYSFNIYSNIQVYNRVYAISNKTIFPIKALDASFYEYTQPTTTIDVTPDIKNVASELSSGTTDLYELEYIYADYVRKNVAYDLGSLTADVDQKSSWVLTNKRGVCDEITNLFISLNRASGIPARFVSGLAYTNLDVFGTSWVPHAWAEVYFPGYGWIPYDVTYGEYGYLDSGHIMFSESSDVTSANVKYSYLGNNVKLHSDPIDSEVNVEDYGPDEKAQYTFSVYANKYNVGFDSYDLVSVNLANTQNYYQVADIYLADTEDVNIIEDVKETVLNKTIHRKEVLLKPKESKTVYWIIQLDGTFQHNYIYTLPITVFNSYNQTSTVNINAKYDYGNIDLDYVKNYLNSKQQESSTKYSDNIMLECNPDKNQFYLEDTVKISCILDNKGDKAFTKVNVCIDNECYFMPLDIELKSLNFEKNFTTLGLKNIEIKVNNSDFSRATYVSINVLDKPELNISYVKYPETVKFDKDFSISFDIDKISESTPRNVTVALHGPLSNQEWFFDSFKDERIFTITSNGKSMKNNDNDYTINISYQDEKGNKYQKEESFIVVSDATFIQKIVLWLNSFAHSIESIFG